MSDLDKFLSESFGAVKQAAEQTVEGARKGLEGFLDAFSSKPSPTPQQAPESPPKGHSIDSVFSGLIQAESRGKHLDDKGKLVKSPMGALGITQLMPDTAKKPGYGIEPVKDDSESEYLRVGKQYLQKMYDKFGDWEKALAAYNAGVGNVMKAEGKAERFGGDWKDFLPKKEETIPYLQKILGKQQEMR